MLIAYWFQQLGWLTSTNCFIYWQNFLEMLAVVCLACFSLKRKKYFVLKAVGSLVVMVGLIYLFALIRDSLNNSTWIRIVLTLLLYGYFYGVMWLLFSENPIDLLLRWSVILLCRESAEIFYSFLLVILGVNSRSTFMFLPSLPAWFNALACDLIHLLVQAGLTYLFNRKENSEKDQEFRLFVISLSLTEILAIVILKTLMLAYQSESNVMFLVSKGLMLILCMIALVMKTFMLKRNQERLDMEVMAEVINSEKKQYESMKANIDIINMKCHDIRHQLEEYHDKLADEEITTLKNAISIYDKSIHTGNPTLDTILYEKELFCEKNQIKLTYLSDGKLLSFLKPSEIYSLINNMLDNAIEAVGKVENPKRKVIGLTVSEQEGSTFIECYNYFNSTMINDDLSTTKEDHRSHGYGLKSIAYIASLYQGEMNYHKEEDMFFLSVRFPQKD